MRFSDLREMLKYNEEAKLKFLSSSPAAQAVMCEFAEEIHSVEDIDNICEIVEVETSANE